jgi:hypothetical protein
MSKELIDLNDNLNGMLRKKVGKVKKSELFRIKALFNQLWCYLMSITFMFFFSFLKSLMINDIFCDRILCLLKNRIKGYMMHFVLIILVLDKGLILCVDGIVSSWLKTPFGQLCYSINKSGIGDNEKDEMIINLTGGNEGFREVFRKYGTGSLSDMPQKEVWLIANYFSTTGQRKEEGVDSDKTISFIWDISLMIPVIYSAYKINGVGRMISRLETENG